MPLWAAHHPHTAHSRTRTHSTLLPAMDTPARMRSFLNMQAVATERWPGLHPHPTLGFAAAAASMALWQMQPVSTRPVAVM